jgi:hypothetical protein
MWTNFTARFKCFNSRVLGTVLLTKAILLAFAAQAYQVITNQHLDQNNSILGVWNHWDALHYLKLAENGYSSVGDDRFLIVFFPLYPLLTAIVRFFTHDYLLSAFIVSGLASVALGLLFRELVRLDYSERTAQMAVLFLFVFPTSYFLHIPYTESLFLALVVGAFLAARKRSWLAAGILGGLACLTRINGLILIPALLFELREEYVETHRIDSRWLYLVLIPVGFMAYLFLNLYVGGDAFVFMTYQREHWQRYFRWPWEGIWETVKRINNPKAAEAQMVGFHEALFVAIGLASIIFGWVSLRWSYRVWMVANWLLFVSTSFVLSVPRYTLTLFPMFIVIAVGARRDHYFKVLVTVWSLLFLALFSVQFVRGWWAF